MRCAGETQAPSVRSLPQRSVIAWKGSVASGDRCRKLKVGGQLVGWPCEHPSNICSRRVGVFETREDKHEGKRIVHEIAQDHHAPAR